MKITIWREGDKIKARAENASINDIGSAIGVLAVIIRREVAEVEPIETTEEKLHAYISETMKKVFEENGT